ncbi:energy transducer TonB [Yunchengibacter salinarum]|uniref:energy transducer TonB n=1 Tax=Yunchengibacter salinarum TaxID=3133399 RepID=UPI0035B5CCED
MLRLLSGAVTATLIAILSATASLGAERIGPLTPVGSPGVDLSAWETSVNGKLEDAYFYPRSAMMNGEQGSGALQITMEKGGKVVHVAIAEKPGSAVLDQALNRMQAKINGTSLPGLPGGFAQSHFTFMAKINWLVD